MALSVGDKLGPYEIVAPIGKGGMGEVYRAHDSRLRRDVAIKVSAERFSERFEKEARAIASLNHPNVCTLHDVGPNYLVMELVEGQTLAERIKEGAIPLEEALGIARQIADALEAAHEKGITHRDLKPGNIKIKPDGMVKVLDFGLAKLGGTPAAKGEDLPTISMAATQAGVILGTAAYMAPEQARGKPVDKRADIWAFGVVLYEMLTGKRLFQGEDMTDTLAAVLRKEPEWDRIPAKVRRLLKSCLEKDPKHRLRDIGDAWKLLEEKPASASGGKPWPWMAAAGVLVLALAVVIAMALGLRDSRQNATVPAETYQLSVVTPETSSLLDFAISPDGHTLAFVARAEDGKQLLWVRRLDAASAQPLPGTEGAAQPFWAPDSRSLGFFAEGKLKKTEAAGGPPQTIADSPSSRGGAWNRDGVILFAPSTGVGLFRVSAAGGALTPVTVLDPKKESGHRWPEFLPDGRHFLFFVQAGRGGGVSVGSLDAKETRHLLDTNMQAWYAPPGFLLFVRDGSLMAQSFDARKAELGGDPMRIAEGLMFEPANRAAFSTVGTGILAYRSGSAQNQMAWFDRSGKSLGTAGPRGGFYSPELSPDAKQVAFARGDLRTGNQDVWLLDLARGEPRRLTFDPAVDIIPRWSPDGKQIIFQSNRDGPFNIYQKLSSGAGSEERLFPSPVTVSPQDWSADGRFLVYTVPDAKGNRQLWVLPMFGERKPVPFVENGATNYYAGFSHDSRWIAYASNESGKYEVYVQSFPAGNGKWQVSTGGGVQPRWSRDGKELFYLGLDRKLMAVPVRSGSTLEFGAGVPLFEARMESGTNVNMGTMQQYAVTPDGQRFLLNLEPDSAASPITVVLNWNALLKK